MSILSIPRFIISSDRSSSGKTTISMGIMSMLTKMGYSVQPFKVALDYIDPEYHSEITGRDCRNLDGYLMNEHELVDIFLHACKMKDKLNRKADIAVIEGVRGLYEGIDGIEDIGSTAQIAKLLDAPIIFIINAKSMTKSCAALINGFSSLDKNIRICGIVLNNIGSEKHSQKALQAIKYYTSIPVVGIIYRNSNIKLETRELGLKSIPEQIRNKEEYDLKINFLSKIIENGININSILEISKNTKKLISIDEEKSHFRKKTENQLKLNIKIGVPYDEAFNFYYKDNLDIFESYGISIVKFSILHDKKIPIDIQALYIGGGNISYFLEDLENNISMRHSIKHAADIGMPIFGESSGMNYLTNKIKKTDENGNEVEYEMVGALPGTTIILKNRRFVTYTNGIFTKDSIIGNEADVFKAHEFHNTKIVDLPKDTKYTISILRGFGIENMKDGISKNNTIGTYCHFHGVSSKFWIKKFITSAFDYKINILKEKQFKNHE